VWQYLIDFVRDLGYNYKVDCIGCSGSLVYLSGVICNSKGTKYVNSLII